VGTPALASLALVDGDFTVTGSLVGAGLLFIDGILDIVGSLDFTGVVVASGGVRIASAGNLTIAGALWLGAPPSPGAALVVDGRVALGQDHAAVEWIDTRLTLPRRATVLGLQDGI
jgi:hypothetical protein